MVISEIMTTNPATAKATSTVASALAILHNLDVRHLPITDGGEIVGILSDRDLRGFADFDRFDPDQADDIREKLNTSVADIMATDLVTLDQESELTEAIDVMLEQRIGAIPIVNKNTRDLVGILSYIDILKALRKDA